MPSPNEDLSSGSVFYYERYLPNGVQGPYSQGFRETLRRTRTTTSVQTPNFKKLKRRLLPINPYSKTVRVFSDAKSEGRLPFYRKSDNYNEYYRYDVNVGLFGKGPDNVSPADDPSQRAILKLLEDLSSTKVNTLVAAAEVNKTAAHVAKTATRIYNAIRAIKHGDYKELTRSLGITEPPARRKRFNKRYREMWDLGPQDPKKRIPRGSRPVYPDQTRASKFLGETWLEYSYGWKPLLKDVYDHAKALAELSIERLNVTRFAKAGAYTQSKKTVYDSPSGFTYLSLTRSSEDKRWVEFGVRYSIQNGQLNTFTQLGIDNPMEVAWELVPFSFVADWFLPIGSFLRSLTATSGLVFHDGYKSERRFLRVENIMQSNGHFSGTADGSGNGREGPWSGGPFTQTLEELTISRSRLLEFMKPIVPEFRNPFGKGADYGLTKATSAVALLQSLFL
jgi:hypothetical protein